MVSGFQTLAGVCLSLDLVQNRLVSQDGHRPTPTRRAIDLSTSLSLAQRPSNFAKYKAVQIHASLFALPPLRSVTQAAIPQAGTNAAVVLGSAGCTGHFRSGHTVVAADGLKVFLVLVVISRAVY